MNLLQYISLRTQWLTTWRRDVYYRLKMKWKPFLFFAKSLGFVFCFTQFQRNYLKILVFSSSFLLAVHAVAMKYCIAYYFKTLIWWNAAVMFSPLTLTEMSVSWVEPPRRSIVNKNKNLLLPFKKYILN